MQNPQRQIVSFINKTTYWSSQNFKEEVIYTYSQNSVAAEVVLVMLVPFIELSTAEKHKSAKKQD